MPTAEQFLLPLLQDIQTLGDGFEIVMGLLTYRVKVRVL